MRAMSFLCRERRIVTTDDARNNSDER
jgi:hypothetical protein